jgi:hypothetical protein
MAPVAVGKNPLTSAVRVFHTKVVDREENGRVPSVSWARTRKFLEIVVSDMALRVVCVVFVAALLAFTFSSLDVASGGVLDEVPYVGCARGELTLSLL